MSKARQLADFSSVAPDIGRKNILINSAFQVSQRGDFTTASSSTNGNYFVDRWLSAQDVITANKQHLYNQTITSDITAHTLKITATSSGTGNFQLSQPIERVNQELGNKTLTYSVWVKTNNSNVRLRGIFDDSGWTQFDAVHTGDDTWQKLSTTFTTGATRSAGHYQVQVLAYNNSNVSIASGDYIEIAQPQVEIGSVATPFEHRSFGEELALCQRYYEKSYNAETAPGSSDATGMVRTSISAIGDSSSKTYIPFKVAKRAAPAMTAYRDGGATGNWYYLRNGQSTESAVTFAHTGTQGTNAGPNLGSAWATANTYGHWTADAEL